MNLVLKSVLHFAPCASRAQARLKTPQARGGKVYCKMCAPWCTSPYASSALAG